MTVSSIDTVPE